jgi:antitoxin VapB
MSFIIQGEEAEKLVAELARLTGESKADAVAKALRERLERVKRVRGKRSLADELDAIAKQCAELPVLDSRIPDEILGYDDSGLPS